MSNVFPNKIFKQKSHSYKKYNNVHQAAKIILLLSTLHHHRFKTAEQ